VNEFIGRILHLWFKRPFTLARTIDEGEGSPVVLLHGIGRTGSVWQNVVKDLRKYQYHIVAFDLLGFGQSPKPGYIDYTVDDHAKAVINSLQKMKKEKPFVIVGHSMGCLIAVRVARLRPDLVKHLVLYEMPLYEGLPEKRMYKLRLNIYLRFYQWVIGYTPIYDEENRKRLDKLAMKIIGFDVTEETWLPFIRSLENTIIKQTTHQDIPFLSIPIDVIYGLYDMLVIRGKTEHIFGSDAKNVKAHNVRARHEISTSASKLIVQRIAGAIASAKAS
jgi:pimeloyl-ACP methyl ester carboxylesterase